MESKRIIRKYWDEKAEDFFIGKKIVEARYLTEEEMIAKEIQEQNEFENWLENRRKHLAENSPENQENAVNLFWSSEEEN